MGHPFHGMKVVILHDPVTEDARPDVQDTMQQVSVVGEALRRLGFVVRTMAAPVDTLALEQALWSARPTLVFNLVESHPGLLLAPRILTRCGYTYTGCGAAAMLISTDKVAAKRRMVAAQIPTPPWVSIERLPDAMHFDQPFIIKPVNEDASVGIGPESIVANAEDLHQWKAAHGIDNSEGWFAERFVAGREFNLSILERSSGPQLLPMAEILFDGFPEGRPYVVDYDAKWKKGSPEYRGTRRVFGNNGEDRLLGERLQAMGAACWNAFHLSGYARVDFRVDAEGNPWVLEVNANPCLSPDAGFAAAVRQGGHSFTDGIECIVAAAFIACGDEKLAQAQ